MLHEFTILASGIILSKRAHLHDTSTFHFCLYVQLPFLLLSASVLHMTLTRGPCGPELLKEVDLAVNDSLGDFALNKGLESMKDHTVTVSDSLCT